VCLTGYWGRAPITGKIRKFFILNVAGSLGIGTALGYWFWCASLLSAVLSHLKL
jgi:hypothetical protein